MNYILVSKQALENQFGILAPFGLKECLCLIETTLQKQTKAYLGSNSSVIRTSLCSAG